MIGLNRRGGDLALSIAAAAISLPTEMRTIEVRKMPRTSFALAPRARHLNSSRRYRSANGLAIDFDPVSVRPTLRSRKGAFPWGLHISL